MYDVLKAVPFPTTAFISVIIIVTLYFQVRFTLNSLIYGPIILTMLGILGCFVGITLGLLNFNTADVQSSVPTLLEGIKTSFFASIAGIFCALTIKFRYLLIGAPRFRMGRVVQGATIDDLATLLRSLHQSLAGSEDRPS